MTAYPSDNVKGHMVYIQAEADEVIAYWKDLSEVAHANTMEYKRRELAKDETIAKLKELVRFCCTEFSDGTMPEEYIWNESETKKRLDSILGPHSDPPATAMTPEDAKQEGATTRDYVLQQGASARQQKG